LGGPRSRPQAHILWRGLRSCGGINALARLAAAPKRGIRLFQTLALAEEIVDLRRHSAEEQFGRRRARRSNSISRPWARICPRIRAISLRM
jgi:hypothetical protein